MEEKWSNFQSFGPSKNSNGNFSKIQGFTGIRTQKMSSVTKQLLLEKLSITKVNWVQFPVLTDTYSQLFLHACLSAMNTREGKLPEISLLCYA